MIALTLGRLTAEVTGHRVELRGRIDDSSPPHTLASQLPPQLPPGEVVLDTGGVTFVSSFGIREWMRLLRVLRERGPVVLERVTDVLIVQMNTIPELARDLRVVSFFAQYACPACGAERAPLIDAIAHAESLRQMQAPPQPCLECGGPMELGDFPERYLSIFRSA